MKLGIISDIHGDAAALERAFTHLTAMRVGQIVCAGDLVGYGPFPDRVVAFLREQSILSVRGNHDRWALSRGPGVPDEFGGGTPRLETLCLPQDATPRSPDPGRHASRRDRARLALQRHGVRHAADAPA